MPTALARFRRLRHAVFTWLACGGNSVHAAAAQQLGRRCVVCTQLVGACTVISPAAATAADARGFVLAVPAREGLTSRWLEQLRVFLQDEADAVQYGGELAPGGPPSGAPALLLVPIVQMQSVLERCAAQLSDQRRWPALVEVLTSGPFATKEFKRIFNAYADNIYYASGSAEANAYLLGGATPSTLQTRQYLLRNEALKQLGELVDELAYQQTQPAAERDAEVAQEYLGALLAVFTEYLDLAPPEELKFARLAKPKPETSQ